jgi:hypothetical protein
VKTDQLLRHIAWASASLTLAWSFAIAQEEAPAAQKAQATKVAAKSATSDKKGGTKSESAEAKALSGMSILGNQEAPKALVIVPWKSSQLGDALGINKTLDDSRQPVDKDVFMRELAYYEIRHSSSNPTSK